jgi:ATP-dependent Clp protease ATP-binding subunit ClpX
LLSIVENILLDTMFDLPDFEGVDEIVIDKDVVAGTKEPVKVIAKSSKAKKEDAA